MEHVEDDIDYKNHLKINDEVIDRVNELIGSDISLLTAENSKELIAKLKAKINSLRDNFIVSLPHQYNDKNEFLKFCNKINDLKERLDELKDEHTKIKSFMGDLMNQEDTQEGEEWREELKGLVLERINTKRKACYLKCLTRIEELKY